MNGLVLDEFVQSPSCDDYHSNFTSPYPLREIAKLRTGRSRKEIASGEVHFLPRECVIVGIFLALRQLSMRFSSSEVPAAFEAGGRL